jgi:hypothetical protein
MIPEVILHKAIVQGVRAIREDSRILDSMFKNLPQDTLQALKDVVLKQKLNLSINYPRADALKLPMISIILKNEAESHTFLGDVMGSPPYYGMPDSELSYELLGGGVPEPMGGLPAPIGPVFSVGSYEYDTTKSKTLLTPLDPSGELTTLRTIPDSYLWVVAGTGVGEKLRILAIDGITIKLDGLLSATLDASSKVEIRPTSNPEASIGEPSKVYNQDQTNLVRKGANYDVQYQLSIIAGHQDEVLYLYSIMKALLFSQRKFLESQGIMALKISGTDFAPRSDFLPTEVFQRVMTLQFVYPFTFIEELDSYSSIEFSLDTGTTRATDCGVVTFDVTL